MSNQIPTTGVFTDAEFDEMIEASSKTTIGLHRGDLGMQRSRIAPLLSGEELAEMFALADFQISAGGSVVFGKPSDMEKRLKSLRLVERVRDAGAPGLKIRRLTQLGWLTLLTRAEHEMRHLLPPDKDCAA